MQAARTRKLEQDLKSVSGCAEDPAAARMTNQLARQAVATRRAGASARLNSTATADDSAGNNARLPHSTHTLTQVHRPNRAATVRERSLAPEFVDGIELERRRSSAHTRSRGRADRRAGPSSSRCPAPSRSWPRYPRGRRSGSATSRNRPCRARGVGLRRRSCPPLTPPPAKKANCCGQ